MTCSIYVASFPTAPRSRMSGRISKQAKSRSPWLWRSANCLVKQTDRGCGTSCARVPKILQLFRVSNLKQAYTKRTLVDDTHPKVIRRTFHRTAHVIITVRIPRFHSRDRVSAGLLPLPNACSCHLYRHGFPFTHTHSLFSHILILILVYSQHASPP